MVAEAMDYQVPTEAIGNRTDRKILSILEEEGSASMSRIVEETDKANGYVSDRIDVLESWNLVTRVENPDDNRRVLVELNEDSVVV